MIRETRLSDWNTMYPGRGAVISLEEKKRHANAYRMDRWARKAMTIGGLLVIFLTLAIGAFLVYRGMATFTTYGHSPWEFFFSSTWKPNDSTVAGGAVGASIFIVGSLLTCMIALLIATPLSLGTAIFMTEISPKWGSQVLQPVIEIFVGIPSVVYGWLGLTVLVPAIQKFFDLPTGFSVLAASLVLALMIFPTITSLATEAIRSVSPEPRKAAYGLGATRWQVIYQVVLPMATAGLSTAIILGLARAFGEALAVAMVIGKMKAFPTSILSPTTNLTATMAADMGGAMEGGEYNMALWTMALLLFVISAFFILLVHYIAKKSRSFA